MPSKETIRLWKLGNPEFLAQYAQARQEQADFLSEECLEIADKATPEEAAVARLRVDTRKWYAGKMHPRVYGEKASEVTVNNSVHNYVVAPEKLKEIRQRHAKALEGYAR